MSTPVNTISRENLTVLIRNNIIVQTEEFESDTEMVSTFLAYIGRNFFCTRF